ncbi:hypothetical protein GCK72_006984 [Caenorhabditis remanei]|uniref:Uncharacterized protein n=1 Tax=Caenorhabditis remanei TaxID=31234 RepID=A0A6A5HK15_CAERE|nr:hypothetical protein GCK72_006984 [Caenorhabditis remanei]KAF1767026.1 hypothetical protein GCK72_006984 [Caenorhabditis remanei]
MEDIKYAETIKNMETIIEELKAELAEKDKKVAEKTEKIEILITNIYQEREIAAKDVEKLHGEVIGEEKVLKDVEDFKDKTNRRLEWIREKFRQKNDNLKYDCNKKKNDWNEKKYELMIRNTQLVVQLDEKDAAIMVLKGELETIRENFKREEEAKEQLAEKNAELETEKKKQLNEAENERKGFQEQIGNLQKDCQRLEKEKTDLATSKRPLDIEKLKRLEFLEKQKKQMMEYRRKYELERAEDKKKTAFLEQENFKLKAELQSKNEENKTLHGRLENKIPISSCEPNESVRIGILQKRIKLLEKEMREREEKEEELGWDNDADYEEDKDLEKEKEEIRCDKEALNVEKKRMKEEKEELIQKKVQFEKDAKTFQRQKQEFQKDKEIHQEAKKEFDHKKHEFLKERKDFQDSLEERLRDEYAAVFNGNKHKMDLINSLAKDIVKVTQHGHPEVNKFGLQILKKGNEEADDRHPEVSDLISYLENQETHTSKKRTAEKSEEEPFKKKKE